MAQAYIGAPILSFDAGEVGRSAMMEPISMFPRKLGYVAPLQAILILPAAVFMAALGLRTVPVFQQQAQEVVMLYAHRVWTLWVLLLSLPLCVVAAGSLAMLSSPVAARAEASRAVAAMTAVALVILAIVVAHMLAN